MRSLFRLTVGFLLLGGVVFPAQAAFTSLYVFGDGVCTTTDTNASGSYYYGNRYCNGRVWVEVLAERQGLTYESNKNLSYFGNYSSNMVADVTNFTAPPDANTALFAIWVNNADFVYNTGHYTTNDVAAWTNAINQSVTNHWKAITNLYAKGARTMVMPNAVDIMKVPANVYAPSGDKNFVRQKIIDFNTAFTAMLNNVRTSFTNVTIYEPDMFTLLDNIVTNAAYYGLTNALLAGESVDALDDPSLTDHSLNGSGTNYIFWDDLDPTAAAHAVIADEIQQLISPVGITKITSFNGTNRLDVVNIPIGLNGFVDGSTNFTGWASEANFNSTNATQAIFIPVAGPLGFYRLRFPFNWYWP